MSAQPNIGMQVTTFENPMGIDGFELCRQIKMQDDFAHIPVVMISASPDLESQAYAAGADNFLEKPFSKRQLLDSIESLLMKES